MCVPVRVFIKRQISRSAFFLVYTDVDQTKSNQGKEKSIWLFLLLAFLKMM